MLYWCTLLVQKLTANMSCIRNGHDETFLRTSKEQKHPCPPTAITGQKIMERVSKTPTVVYVVVSKNKKERKSTTIHDHVVASTKTHDIEQTRKKQM